MELSQVSAVLVTSQLNVGVFQQLWLQENGILTRDELLVEGSVFTPVAVKIQTEEFEFLAVQDRIQVIVHSVDPSVQAGSILQRIFLGIVKALPGISMVAFGLNFIWRIRDVDELAEKVKSLFLPAQNPFSSAFNSSDSRCGIYISKDSLEGRLRLDVTPLIDRGGRDGMSLRFNYHWDVSGQNELELSIDKYADANAEAEKIANLLSSAV